MKLPEATVERLDKLRAETKTSRNGLVLEMIEDNLASRRGRSAAEKLAHLGGIVKNAPADGSTSNAWRQRLER
ncbi:MAG: hypothetical protein ABSC03_18375 [Verrucomicrobiota bacterium]